MWLVLSFAPLLVFGLRLLIIHAPGTPVAFVQLGVSSLAFYFVLLMSMKGKAWRFHQEKQKMRFAAVYAAGLLLSFVCSFVSPLCWPYLPLAALLLLSSDLPQAFGGYFSLLILQVFLSELQPEVFVSFSLIGCIGILMFSFLDDDFLFGVPLFCSLLFQTLLLLCVALGQGKLFAPKSILLIVLNLIFCFLLLTGILKYMSTRVIHKAIDLYAELNDPENSLLVQLKEKSQRSYYHAVHTAHFCEKLADRIGADAPLCKAGGYYHKIGKLRGETNLRNTLDIAKENEFPKELVRLLREYGAPKEPLHSREAGILLLSDAMVSSVMFLFDKNKDAQLDYAQITQVVFSKQIEGGYLERCRLTMEELWIIKKCFMEETLYYDFLR